MNRPDLRVAHIIAPSAVGGAEQVVLDLTSALAGQGIDVHLVAIVGDGEETHPFVVRVDSAVTLHVLQVPHRKYLDEWRKVGKVLGSSRPDLVHTHGYRADVLSGAVARRLGIPLVSTVHGFTGGSARNRFYEWLQRRAYVMTDRVIAVSQVLADELERRPGSGSRVVTVPNARSFPADVLGRDEARRELGLPESGFHVGWVGRISREKGPDVMIEAMERLLADPELPEITLTLIGEGRERAPLEALTSHPRFKGRVRWAGRRPDAARFLNAFDVLALSSRTEGTPIVLLEAMLSETPLVATHVGGVPDLVRAQDGLLVPPEDPDAMAHAVKSVMNDPEVASRRAASARARAARIAAPSSWARQHIKIYRDVLRSRAGASGIMAFLLPIVLLLNGCSEARSTVLIEDPSAPARCGIAAQFEGDANIATHPDVLFYENFEHRSVERLSADYTSVRNPSNLSFADQVAPESFGITSLRMRSVGGRDTGAHLYRPLDGGFERIHLRYYVRYDGGHRYHHTGGTLGGYAPSTPWPQGGAGIRPDGRDRFTVRFEPVSFGSTLDLYTYWMEMRGNPGDESFWGNTFMRGARPSIPDREWLAVEFMIKLNDPVETRNGELALWLDGVPVVHLRQGEPHGWWVWDQFEPDPEGEPFDGFRWRASGDLLVSFVWLSHFVTGHGEGEVSDVWFNDVVVATDYIGPIGGGTCQE